jgi:hypothetical protein
MVRPASFGWNPETQASNSYQRNVEADACGAAARARAESDAVARALRKAGVDVYDFDDREQPACPDAVFPNNWISFHADGTVVLYPMLAPNRRLERRMDVLRRLEEQGSFRVTRTVDLSHREAQQKFLEGTGSLVRDLPLLQLEDIGFRRTDLDALGVVTGMSGAARLLARFKRRIDRYHAQRDFPAVKGTSHLSTHLRFGTVSIRQLAGYAWRLGGSGALAWLSELIWRDFYHQILHHHPQVVDHAFRPEYDRIHWERGAHAQARFQAWCEGRTGYPLVDAAMHQLNETGYMHNRLRMVSASFLIKDLGIDWRWGERYFARQLNDYDLAANNGGWQWAASSGCDAQPYFRIFNPVSQSEKFDPQGKFIRRYLPALARLDAPAIHAPWRAPALELEAAGVRLGDNYPHPLVQHEEARRATLERYAVVRSPQG